MTERYELYQHDRQINKQRRSRHPLTMSPDGDARTIEKHESQPELDLSYGRHPSAIQFPIPDGALAHDCILDTRIKTSGTVELQKDRHEANTPIQILGMQDVLPVPLLASQSTLSTESMCGAVVVKCQQTVPQSQFLRAIGLQPRNHKRDVICSSGITMTEQMLPTSSSGYGSTSNDVLNVKTIKENASNKRVFSSISNDAFLTLRSSTKCGKVGNCEDYDMSNTKIHQPNTNKSTLIKVNSVAISSGTFSSSDGIGCRNPKRINDCSIANSNSMHIENNTNSSLMVISESRRPMSKGQNVEARQTNTTETLPLSTTFNDHPTRQDAHQASSNPQQQNVTDACYIIATWKLNGGSIDIFEKQKQIYESNYGQEGLKTLIDALSRANDSNISGEWYLLFLNMCNPIKAVGIFISSILMLEFVRLYGSSDEKLFELASYAADSRLPTANTEIWVSIISYMHRQQLLNAISKTQMGISSQELHMGDIIRWIEYDAKSTQVMLSNKHFIEKISSLLTLQHANMFDIMNNLLKLLFCDLVHPEQILFADPQFVDHNKQRIILQWNLVLQTYLHTFQSNVTISSAPDQPFVSIFRLLTYPCKLSTSKIVYFNVNSIGMKDKLVSFDPTMVRKYASGDPSLPIDINFKVRQKDIETLKYLLCNEFTDKDYLKGRLNYVVVKLADLLKIDDKLFFLFRGIHYMELTDYKNVGDMLHVLIALRRDNEVRQIMSDCFKFSVKADNLYNILNGLSTECVKYCFANNLLQFHDEMDKYKILINWSIDHCETLDSTLNRRLLKKQTYLVFKSVRTLLSPKFIAENLCMMRRHGSMTDDDLRWYIKMHGIAKNNKFNGHF